MPRLHTTATAAPSLLRDDPNYPGLPAQPPADVVARSTSQARVPYETCVLDYGARQRSNLLLAGLGSLLLILAFPFLTGPWLVVAVTLGAVGVVAGLGSLWLTADAHNRYFDELAVATTETYVQPQPTPATTVRPFIPSPDGTATVRVGRFGLPLATWAALLDTADANNGRLTRDAATKILPRSLYRDWQATVGELQRLGLVDHESRPTAAAWALVDGRSSPFPQNDYAPAGAQSTHARRTHGAHGRQGVGE